MIKPPISNGFLENIQHQFYLLAEAFVEESSPLTNKTDFILEIDDSYKECKLINNEKGAEVETLVSRGCFDKGTRGYIITNYTLPEVNINTLCIRKKNDEKNSIHLEIGWFLESELKNT